MLKTPPLFIRYKKGLGLGLLKLRLGLDLLKTRIRAIRKKDC